VKIFINYHKGDARDAASNITKSLIKRFGEVNMFFDSRVVGYYPIDARGFAESESLFSCSPFS